MQGYGGSFEKALGPILGHDPRPLVALNVKFYLSEHLSIDLTTYGIGCLGGISYIIKNYEDQFLDNFWLLCKIFIGFYSLCIFVLTGMREKYLRINIIKRNC